VIRYAITDGTVSFAHGNEAAEALARRCAALAAEGVEFVLIREKQLKAGELASVCRAVIAAVRDVGAGTRVLVARRLDVAVACGADGVNLSGGEGELTVGQVRRLMPEGFVSVSCHSVAEVRRAREAGASTVLFGPVFGKTVSGVEVVAGAGLEPLRDACEVAGEMMVFALGGVTPEKAAACVEAGAAGVAGIRMFFGVEPA
jgi:thiamine-phosphate pyrophosphorylase